MPIVPVPVAVLDLPQILPITVSVSCNRFRSSIMPGGGKVLKREEKGME